MLSVLIMNYNGARHLERCLAALEEQTLPRTEFEVIVWDNDSRDASRTLLETRFPWCRSYFSTKNLGFAGGNNKAAALARGETLVLLNNDTIPDPYWLEELLRVIRRHPGAAVASKLVFASDPSVINSSGLFLLRDGRGADRGFRQPDRGQYEQEEYLFAACAAAAALPRPPHGEPLFDPSYFMYCEDLDEGWRAQLRGRRTVLAPRAVVLHAVGGSGGEASPRFWFHVERNRALTSLKNGDPMLALASGVGLMLRVLRALLFCLFGHPHPKYRRPIVRAVVLAMASFVIHVPRILSERYETRRGVPWPAGPGGFLMPCSTGPGGF